MEVSNWWAIQLVWAECWTPDYCDWFRMILQLTPKENIQPLFASRFRQRFGPCHAVFNFKVSTLNFSPSPRVFQTIGTENGQQKTWSCRLSVPADSVGHLFCMSRLLGERNTRCLVQTTLVIAMASGPVTQPYLIACTVVCRVLGQPIRLSANSPYKRPFPAQILKL